MKRRVVITGMGAVTPIGNTLDEFWNGIKEEKVGIGAITKFDTEDYKVKIAAEVKDFNVKERLDNKAARRMEVFSQYAVAASREAFAMAGLDMEKEDYNKEFQKKLIVPFSALLLFNLNCMKEK